MSPPRPLSREELDAWRGFVAAATRLFGRLDADLRREAAMGLGDYEVLVLLSEAPEKRLRMGELSDAALVSRSRLTYRVDQLERDGLVLRERCDTDRRGAWATLTPAGEDQLRRAFVTHRRGVVDYFAEPVGVQLRPLAAALDQVLTSLGHRRAPKAASASSGAREGRGGTGAGGGTGGAGGDGSSGGGAGGGGAGGCGSG